MHRTFVPINAPDHHCCLISCSLTNEHLTHGIITTNEVDRRMKVIIIDRQDYKKKWFLNKK